MNKTALIHVISQRVAVLSVNGKHPPGVFDVLVESNRYVSQFWLNLTTSLELFLNAKIFELFNEPHSTGIQIRKIITILHNDVIIAVTDLDDVPSIITQ